MIGRKEPDYSNVVIRRVPFDLFYLIHLNYLI